ncbi:uncharacterized protein LOC102085351 [Columba livia]|uniref:uncharacterized protein LOC102085351 n=1 Tax=Columba livia TaxID=8932 RepID=UPI0031BAFB06
MSEGMGEAGEPECGLEDANTNRHLCSSGVCCPVPAGERWGSAAPPSWMWGVESIPGGALRSQRHRGMACARSQLCRRMLCRGTPRSPLPCWCWKEETAIAAPHRAAARFVCWNLRLHPEMCRFHSISSSCRCPEQPKTGQAGPAERTGSQD